MLGQENYLDSSTKKFEEEKIGQRRFKNNLKLVALNETVAKSHRQQHVCYNDYNGLKHSQTAYCQDLTPFSYVLISIL